MSLSDYPKLSAWSEGLMERASWQKTQPSPEELEAAKTRMKAVIAEQQTH